jgi:hypothetical protein
MMPVESPHDGRARVHRPETILNGDWHVDRISRKIFVSRVSTLLIEKPMPLALVVAAASLSTPIPTPPIFVAGDYALTFRAPPDTTTCALPPDWVGSNHGTVIFLRPPFSDSDGKSGSFGVGSPCPVEGKFF